MSEDEILVTLAAVAMGPVAWLAQVARWSKLPRGGGAVRAIAVVLAICTAILVGVLRTLAASDVIHAPAYIFMYAVLGLAWIRVAALGFPFAGLSLRDDAVERRNGAAITAAAGALIGVTICYAGGNVGDGPGWWVVVFSAALATAGLFVCWLVLAQLTSVHDVVTIDRDPAAGIRLAGFLVACGLLWARAVAGSWESAAQTVRDAAIALPPLAVILAVALAVERGARPRAERPRAPVVLLGILPAMLYLAIAADVVVRLGRPE